MKQNSAGRATGLSLVLLLIVALIAACLAVTQFTSIRKPTNSEPATDLVQQAQDTVYAINQAQQQAEQAP